MTLRSNK